MACVAHNSLCAIGIRSQDGQNIDLLQLNDPIVTSSVDTVDKQQQLSSPELTVTDNGDFVRDIGLWPNHLSSDAVSFWI